MSETTNLRVQFFGSLRDFGDPTGEAVEIACAPSVGALREALRARFAVTHPGSAAAEILRDSVFSDERNVLAADASLEGRSWIAVLPPVCGG